MDRKRYQACKAAGICTGCANPDKQLHTKYLCAECNEKNKEARQRTYERRRARGLCLCGRTQVEPGRVCDDCREASRQWWHNRKAADISAYQKRQEVKCEYRREHWLKLKQQVFEAYGGAVCACCGECIFEFLQLDHVNNNGADHRRGLASYSQVYQDLRNNGFPSGYQVLCANCNWSKRIDGTCVHQKYKEISDAA